jgi:hypothetical protein
MRGRPFLLASFLAISNLEAAPATADVVSADESHFCVIDETICFEDVSSILRLPDLTGERIEYSGQTWSISWGDANGNLWPDLYLNHHTDRSTNERFPRSHLILDLGKDPAAWEFRELGKGDQHSALFIDLDRDGDEEILELIGGRSGAASFEDRNSMNVVHKLGTDPVSAASPVEMAIELGLAYPGARGRSAVPLVRNGELSLLLINASRQDGLAGTALFRRTASGKFVPDESAFTTAECTLPKDCKDVDFNIGVYGEATAFHANDDNLVDLFFYGRGNKSSGRLFLASADAEGNHSYSNSGNFVVNSSDVSVSDFDNDGNFELIFANRRGVNFVRFEGDTVLGSVIPSEKENPIGLVTGDLNNDKYMDIAVYYRTGRNGPFRFSILINDGGGNFFKSEFLDDANRGDARNMSIADYNLDGALDLIFSDGRGDDEEAKVYGGYTLLKGMTENNWLQVDLIDPQMLRGLGARVTVITSDGTRMQRGQYFGVHSEVQDFKRLHFGLGDSAEVTVAVKWADGTEKLLDKVKANQIISISQ